jgi:hypothetical protein
MGIMPPHTYTIIGTSFTLNLIMETNIYIVVNIEYKLGSMNNEPPVPIIIKYAIICMGHPRLKS